MNSLLFYITIGLSVLSMSCTNGFDALKTSDSSSLSNKDILASGSPQLRLVSQEGTLVISSGLDASTTGDRSFSWLKRADGESIFSEVGHSGQDLEVAKLGESFSGRVKLLLSIIIDNKKYEIISAPLQIAVSDLNPPSEPLNQLPIANAGADIEYIDDDGNGTESTRLDGSGSSDTDGSIVSYNWQLDGSTIATGVNPAVRFDIGEYMLTLVVTDDMGATAQDQVRVVLVSENSEPAPEPQPQPNPGGLKAFPTAEGFGSDTPGGRGGRVIKVTNLNDSGTGSLRAALTASGPRIVVFTVSGIINLESRVRVVTPYMTVAGQTSPGGILVTGLRVELQAHDIILRHMRFRVGSHRVKDGSADPSSQDALVLNGPGEGHSPGAKNIIIDHCSFSWGVDETVSTSYGASDFTIQWSTISRSLSRAGHPEGEHSKGMLFSGKRAENDIQFSFHHNFMAHNGGRNPEIAEPHNGYSIFGDMRNNVIYNWHSGLGPSHKSGATGNWVANYVQPGPNSKDSYAVRAARDEDWSPIFPAIFVDRNIAAIQDPNGWDVSEYYYQTHTADIGLRLLSPIPAPSILTNTMNDSYALEIVNQAGATVPVRDYVDRDNSTQFQNGTGRIIDDVVYSEEYNKLSQDLRPANYPTDNDNDGMSDAWEALNGLNILQDDSAGDADGDGYTNIEEYINGLADKLF